jgi:hypothetical protein
LLVWLKREELNDTKRIERIATIIVRLFILHFPPFVLIFWPSMFPFCLAPLRRIIPWYGSEIVRYYRWYGEMKDLELGTSALAFYGKSYTLRQHIEN